VRSRLGDECRQFGPVGYLEHGVAAHGRMVARESTFARGCQ
jgi:hypothetical protein